MRYLLCTLLAVATFAIGPGIGPAARAAVYDDALAHWTFDTDFSDTAGTYNGTAVGSPTIVTGAYESVIGGGALSLNGVDQAIEFGDMWFEDFTLSAWVFPQNIATGTSSTAIVLGDGTDAASNQNWIRLESTTVRFKFSGSTVYPSTSESFGNHVWQHCVITRENDLVTVYRNGTEVASVSDVWNLFVPSHIGCKGNNFYKGLMDEVAVWDRAISSTEIEELYSQVTWPELGSLDAVVAGLIDVPGDASDTTASIAFSTDSRLSVAASSLGSFTPALDGAGMNASNGVLMANAAVTEVYDPAVDTDRYPTVSVGPLSAADLTVATMKKGAGNPTRISADTAVAWFSFSDGWIAGHVNADGTLYAGNGVDDSMITYHEVTNTYDGTEHGPAPAYDLAIPGATPGMGMLFAVASSTDTSTAEQPYFASTMETDDGGWRVSVLNNDQGTYPDLSVANEFSFVYIPFATEGLVGGYVQENGTVGGDRAVGDFTVENVGTGTFELTLADYTPEDGILLLSILDEHIPTAMPQDDWITYAPSEDGLSFTIVTRDCDTNAGGNSVASSGFVFAFIPIEEGTAPVLEGDLNGDGSVGSADLDLVRGNWGRTDASGLLEGDATGDGQVGSADLDVVRANWGRTASAAAVPEPGIVSLAACAACAVFFRRRR